MEKLETGPPVVTEIVWPVAADAGAEVMVGRVRRLPSELNK
jgi:hypothetical protein